MNHLAHLLIPGHMVIDNEHQLDARVTDVAAHNTSNVTASRDPWCEDMHRSADLPIHPVVLGGVQQAKI